MRVDIVTIFPDYLSPLTLSLVGKARERGLLDVRLHDLRDYTDDVHRSVDDTPYGGGPGMVMRPEPWGSALDAIALSAPQGEALPLLIVPTPAGVPFTPHCTRPLYGLPVLGIMAPGCPVADPVTST